MRHEVILKRDDGSKVRITVSFRMDNYRSEPAQYNCEVDYCLPRKRKFIPSYSTDDYEFRKKSGEDRKRYALEKQLLYVTAKELYDAKVELWKKLQPN